MSIWRRRKARANRALSAPAQSGAPVTPAVASTRNLGRRRFGTTILATGLAGLLAISAALLGASAAEAAVAPVNITDAKITGTPPKQIGDQFRLELAWNIADGAAIAGDTFQVELPQTLRGVPTSFKLNNPDGDAVANCEVEVTGEQNSPTERTYVTCTFTDFVTSHPLNVKGSMEFSAVAISEASQYNIAGHIIGLTTKIPPNTGGGGGGGDRTELMPEFSKTGAVYQDGTVGFQVKIPYSLLVAGGGSDVTIVDNYDSGLPAPVSINMDLVNTGLNPAKNVPVSQGSGAGQYTLTKEPAKHRFTIVYHDVSTIAATQYLKLDYNFGKITDVEAGTPFDNEVTVGSETRTVQVVYNVGGTGTGDGTARGRARVTKVDATDPDHLLTGAKFDILDSTGEVVGTFGPTGADGQAVSKTFDPGDYTIVETTAPAGYTLDPTPHPVTLVAGKTTAITIENTLAPTGSLEITKHITGDAATSVPAGTQFDIDYAYTTNGDDHTGTLTVTDGTTATLTDIPDGTVVTFTEATPTAVPGATWATPVFSGTGVTQTGNSAQVTASGNQTIHIGLENPITVNPAPAIELVKTADTDKIEAGQTITYTFVATNLGNTTLKNVTISETSFNGSGDLSDLDCETEPVNGLAPGATLTCTATYTATQTDVDQGNLANTASVVGTPPTGPDVTDTDDVTIDGEQHPEIAVVKTANRTKYAVGDLVTYTLTATNTGNTTLKNVTITDDTFNGSGDLSDLDCETEPVDGLAPGATLTCTATYTATQADVDQGNLANTAHVVGTSPNGTDVTDTDDVTIDGDQVIPTNQDDSDNQDDADDQDDPDTDPDTPKAVFGVEDEAPDGDLAFTGFNNTWMLTAGGLFVAIGAGFLLVTRRRRTQPNN